LVERSTTEFSVASQTLSGSSLPAGSSRDRELLRGESINRYVILDRLGEGGMGVVYAGYDPELDRKVALKLLHVHGDSGSEERRGTRFIREARAMARLAHPNVIAIHDVDRVDDKVFIAMEFIDGITLTDWLAEASRSWREVVNVFRQAGRGLAAAHDKGIVHRDFKPDNVLVGRDGRVRVTDFGLARALDEDRSPSDSTTADSMRVPAIPEALSASVTRDGALVGTPAYMAPEQIQRAHVDARSDQWSFCVALFEALHGERPFKARSLPQLAATVLEGRLPELPRSCAVPRWLRSLVARGLQPEPGARWPSMHELLLALDRDPTPRRRRIAVGAFIVGLLGGTLVLSQLSHAQLLQGCRAEGRRAYDGWRSRRADVRSAILSTGVPFAQDAWTRVDQQLDAHAIQWAEARNQACLTAQVDTLDDPSHEVSALQISCLEERLKARDALVGVFGESDEQTVHKAVELVAQLPPLAPCSDAQSLLRRARPPSDPAVRERVEAIRAELVEAEALGMAAKLDEALSVALTARGEAEAIAYAPVTAEVMAMLGELARQIGDVATADDDLTAAYFMASRVHHDEIAAKAAISLVHLEGVEQSRYDEGEMWARHAEVAIERSGDDPRLRGRLLHALGGVAEARGQYERSVELLEFALAQFDHVPGAPQLHDVATTSSDLGQVQTHLRRYDEAEANHIRALEIRTTLFGPDHPARAESLHDLGTLARARGDTPPGLPE
jgi:tetratricopeptide (TPR) repeat protein/predicted Ser/Thr protein kinase